MSDSRMATIDFRDESVSDKHLANNPIVFLTIAHSSVKDRMYRNPDGSSVPYSSYTWTQHDSTKPNATFRPSSEGWFSAHDVTTIDKGLHDVWAVVFKRRGYNYLEYLESKPGFWMKVEKDVVKSVCDAAIDAADLFDDETTTPLLTAAANKMIDAMFKQKDDTVLIENWVHYSGHDGDPSISFRIGETAVKRDTNVNSSSSRVTSSSTHHTGCKTERFGNQDTKL